METVTSLLNSQSSDKYVRKEGQKNSYCLSNSNSLPKISIITVTYNSALTLTDTLKSVQLQNYPNIEHIIIDGNSRDETVNIIQSFPHVSKWVSEKDYGLYDAMNKGVQLATGDIIGILNSDDLYAHNDVLCKVAEKFSNNNIDAVYGDLYYVKATNVNKVIRVWKSGKLKSKKANKLPEREKDKTAKEIIPIFKKYAPNSKLAIIPNDPANPSTPSIRLNALIIRITVK